MSFTDTYKGNLFNYNLIAIEPARVLRRLNNGVRRAYRSSHHRQRHCTLAGFTSRADLTFHRSDSNVKQILF